MQPADARDADLRPCSASDGCQPSRCPRTGPCNGAKEAGVCGYRWGDLCFGVARRSAIAQARALVERMYAWRGYRTGSPGGRDDSPHRIAFAGASGPSLVATLTLGLDSPDGLFADELYRTEIDRFRRARRKVCELSAFAVDPQYRSQGLLASLFTIAYLHGRRIHKATDAFIEVNPRHLAFYERVLRFRRIGEMRTCRRVEAPALLLHLDLEQFDAQRASSRAAAWFVDTGPGRPRSAPRSASHPNAQPA